MPARSFPDLEFGTAVMVSDARLLANYFDKLAGPVAFTSEQQRQVAGLGQLATLKTNGLNPGRITVGEYCSVPEAQRYDAVKNPTGARCSIYDHAVNVWGRDPKTGFARRPLDNVGIQYGLKLLNAGVISVDQFLDLNEKVGGFDIDANILPPGGARTVADLDAARERVGRIQLVAPGRAGCLLLSDPLRVLVARPARVDQVGRLRAPKLDDLRVVRRVLGDLRQPLIHLCQCLFEHRCLQ